MKKRPVQNGTLIGKRDTIIRQAYTLFYEKGFHASGVDAILAETGISKRTLYHYFRSKEALVAATIEYYCTTMFDELPEIMKKRGRLPTEQILCIFDLKKEAFARGDYRGCFAINAKLEFEGKDKPIEKACSYFYTVLHEHIATLCLIAKCKHPLPTAEKVTLLWSGAVMLGKMHRTPATMDVAREMAKQVIEADGG